jgi:c-di-GMP-binding flagellar brake protein YcgR
MSKKAPKERRQGPRIRARLALQVERTTRPSTERPLTTESLNVSSGGVNCLVRSQLEPATKVGLTILLPSFGRKGKKTQVITCTGVVVRSQPHPEGEIELACAFTDIKKDDKRLIEEYIGWRLMQDLVDERLSQP